MGRRGCSGMQGLLRFLSGYGPGYRAGPFLHLLCCEEAQALRLALRLVLIGEWKDGVTVRV